MVLISAHRCGAGERPELENTRAALDLALRSGVEYVEVDVQRCADGTFVVHHDGFVLDGDRRRAISTVTYTELELITGPVLRYEDVLTALKGRMRGHIDLKCSSAEALYANPGQTYEAQAAARALAVLGADGFIITGADRAVRAVRDWADSIGVRLLVGLSLGASTRGLGLRGWWRTRRSELWPAARVRASRANLLVAHQRLAALSVARWAARKRFPLLVWTVDSEPALRRWLADPRVWMVTTNFPRRALALRDANQLAVSPRCER